MDHRVVSVSIYNFSVIFYFIKDPRTGAYTRVSLILHKFLNNLFKGIIITTL